MGHMIAIKEWEEDCNPDELRNLDFKFMVSGLYSTSNFKIQYLWNTKPHHGRNFFSWLISITYHF